MNQLAQAFDGARTTSELGGAVADCARRYIGMSALSFLSLSGSVVSPKDVFILGSRNSRRAKQSFIDGLSLIEAELEPFARFFGSKRKAFDVAERYAPNVLHRSETFNCFWRPLAVERQIVGALSSPQRPLGFICVARSARESGFTPDDVRAVESMRVILERGLSAARHLGYGDLDDALRILARATPAPWLLFDAHGKLLWSTDEASVRLSIDAARIGGSLAVRHSAALEKLQTWVRSLARENPAEGWSAPTSLAMWGEEFVMRRFEVFGRALFLVGFADIPTRSPYESTGASSGLVQRAARLARSYSLTPRQTAVLSHLAQGETNKGIASVLGCSESAVELHVTALLMKLTCENRAQLVARFWTDF